MLVAIHSGPKTDIDSLVCKAEEYINSIDEPIVVFLSVSYYGIESKNDRYISKVYSFLETLITFRPKSDVHVLSAFLFVQAGKTC